MAGSRKKTGIRDGGIQEKRLFEVAGSGEKPIGMAGSRKKKRAFEMAGSRIKGNSIWRDRGKSQSGSRDRRENASRDSGIEEEKPIGMAGLSKQIGRDYRIQSLFERPAISGNENS